MQEATNLRADRRRQQAAQLEAEALVRYLRDGVVDEQLSQAIHGIVTKAFAEAVGEAMADPAFRRRIVADLASAIARDLGEQVLESHHLEMASLKRELSKRWASAVPQAVRSSLAGDQPGGPGPPRRLPSGGLFARPAVRLFTVFAAGLVLVAMVLGFIWWPTRDTPKLPLAVANSPLPVTTPSDPDQDAPQALPAVARTWIQVITGRGNRAQASALEQRVAEQAAELGQCWFTNDTVTAIESLLERVSGGERPDRTEIAGVFAECIAADPVSAAPNRAVYGSQALIRELLASSWTCPKTIQGQFPAPAEIVCDGVRGRNTYALLNRFLSCTRFGDVLTIGADSSTADYLVVIYIALVEVGPE